MGGNQGGVRIRSAELSESSTLPLMKSFEIISEISEIEEIASGSAIRLLARLRRLYGHGRWRKMKGKALIRLPNGTVRMAELHWYEAHGIGKKEFKRKRYLD